MEQNQEKSITVNVITPPDVLHNQALSFLLVQPDLNMRTQFQNLIKNFDFHVNVYLYDPEKDEERNLAWLLNISKMVNYTILPVDTLGTIEHNLASYLISLPNTFYLTNDETTPYNMLSANRIYNLDWLYEKLKRGTNE